MVQKERVIDGQFLKVLVAIARTEMSGTGIDLQANWVYGVAVVGVGRVGVPERRRELCGFPAGQ